MVQILSLNVGVFPCIFELCGTMKNGNTRSTEIAQILESLQHKYDVLAFQEIWAKSAYNNLVNNLKHIYPYYTKFKKTCCLLGSGLVIFSREKILSEYSEDFKDYRGDEIFAHKGFLAVNIQYIGEVIVTHLQSGSKIFDKLFGKDKLSTQEIARRQTSQIINYTNDLDKNEIVYILGDFNIVYLSQEYNDFLPIMTTGGFNLGTQYPTYSTTIWGDEQKIIDYCFVKNAEITTTTSNNISPKLADHKALIISLTTLCEK